MSNKFKLTDETKIIGSITFYRIEAIQDFRNVKTGEKGGWIEKESNLSQHDNAWVSGDARVYGDARVFGDARVYGEAQVYGDAWVYGEAQVYGDARVFGDARVYGEAQVSGNAWVYGEAQVYGEARVEAKLSYTKGRFIGGIDGVDKVTNITSQTGTTYWDNQYVLGEYSIESVEEESKTEPQNNEIIELNGKKYKLINE